ncbi:hypothetical protein OAC29_03105 [Planktomarina temperata]|nr:hypothetical protein [Planktomarina temperata]
MTDPTVDPNPFADLTMISLATLKERVEEDRSVELLRRRASYICPSASLLDADMRHQLWFVHHSGLQANQGQNASLTQF